MKKPILLLVDDDPAVLEALEAELSPVLGDFCRIEAFDDPTQTLAAMGSWAGEKRQLALAIVDQKMPGLTGVELLCRLRAWAADATPASGFDPAAHLHAILLTGYAGLDSAVAARNSADVNRYLEKPWNSGLLVQEVRAQLHAALREAGALAGYSFRPVRTEEELLDHLRLRYTVYRDSRLAGFLHEEGLDIDIDPYDRRSDHYGLFFTEGEEWRLVGVHRGVRGDGGHRAPLLDVLAEKDERIRSQVAPVPEHVLPMLGYFSDEEGLRALAPYRSGPTAVGGGDFEATRFALSATHRRGARESLFLARHIVASQVARYFVLMGVDRAFTAVAESHARFYAPFGFRSVARSEVPEIGLRGTLLLLLHSEIRAETVTECQPLAERIRRTDAACCCPAFADCVPDSYVSDDFTTVDLFCPLRARAILTGADRE